jgi:flagellar protein FlaJ
MTRIEALRETIERLVFKYDIKREYFTIVLPVLLGLTLVLVAFLTGHTLSGQQTMQLDDKQKAYEELVKQLNASQGGDSGVTQTLPKQPQLPVGLDHYIIFGIIIALVPYSIDRFFERRKHKQFEDDFTQFLFKLSEMMRAGIDPIKSVIELSKTDIGSITPHIRMAASMMLLGRSFGEGMKNMSESLHSEIISKYVDLVIQASYMGGSVHDLILKASEDMRTMIMIEKEMLGSLQQYTVIFYLAQGIIIFIAYVLSAQLVPFIQGTGTTMIFGSGGDIQKIDFTKSFFHLIMINAALGGIIIGKISEGSLKDGFKHTVILMAASYIICIIAILPLAAVK